MILDLFKLDGKVAVVTGASRGIGRAVSLALAEAGARVVCVSRKLVEVEKTVADIRSTGGDGAALECDVLDGARRGDLVDAAVDRFGRIDILVNNVGGWPPTPALDTTDEHFEKAFRFNVTHAFSLTRAAAPRMVETAGGGSVINISSAAGVNPAPCFAAYGTAKAAMNFLTRELAQDFAPKIRVNAVACGSVETEALATILNDEIRATMVSMTPLGRIATVEDIAACALYLASPAASYVTGQIVGVDGGLNGVNMEMPRARL
ncbi:MAG: glucose 1-dehydrogenase [Candidatus Binatia bacterium]